MARIPVDEGGVSSSASSLDSLGALAAAITAETARALAGEAAAAGVTVPTTAKMDAKILTDVSMALNSGVVTSPSGPFAVTDVGKSFRVTGAGNAGGTLDLIATVQSFTSVTQVTLNSVCLATAGVTAVTAYYGTLDTTAVQNALNLGGVVKVPAGKMIALSHLTPVAGAVLDLTGVIVLQIPSLNHAVVSYTNVGSDPVLLDKFTLINGVFLGTGNEQQNQGVAQVTNITEIMIYGTIAIGLKTTSFYLSECQTSRVLFTNTAAGAGNNGTNYINFVFLSTATNLNGPSNIWAIGNYVNGNGVAPICITGSSTSGPNTAPVNAIIVCNTLQTTAFAGIALESGGAGTSNFYIQWGIIALNIIKQTGSGATAFGIQSTLDSTTHPTDPLLHNYFLIALNLINSAHHGIGTQGSNFLILGNTVDLADQASTGGGIQASSASAVHVVGVGVAQNHIRMGAGSASAITMTHCDDSYTDRNDVAYAAGATANSEGIIIVGCLDFTMRGDKVRNAPSRAFRIDTSGDVLASELYAFNPCTTNNSEALIITGAGSGNIVVKNSHFYDNRGAGSKIAHAINNAGTIATCSTGGNSQIGCTGAATLGTWSALTLF